MKKILCFALIVALLLDNHFDGRSLKTKGIAQTVFNISLIREMEKRLAVTKDHEGGGIGGAAFCVI